MLREVALTEPARESIGAIRSFNWETAGGPRVRPIRKRA